MSVVESKKTFVDTSAAELAFRAGQTLEELLMQRAVHSVQHTTTRVVTVERVLSSFDDSLLEHLRRRVEAMGNADAKQEQRKSA